MDDVFEKIGKAEIGKIDELLNAALERKRKLFPEWEILYLAMPKKDTQKWKPTLDQVYAYLKLGKDG